MGIVVRQSIITSIISYIGVGIGYINLLYLYPKFLEPDQVGLLRTIQDAAMLLTPFAQFGLAQSIIRFYPHFSENKSQGKRFINFILLLGCLGYGVFILIFFAFENNIVAFFSDNAREVVRYTNLILWLTFVLLATALLEQYSRSLLKIAFPSFMREVGNRLFQGILVTCYFLKFISFDQFLLLSVLVYILSLIILTVYLIAGDHLSFTLSNLSITKKKIKEIILFSSLSFVGASSMILIGKMDSIMVAAMLGLSANAIYTTAFYMATVIEIPKRAITLSASTLIARAFEKNDLTEVHKIYWKTAMNQFIIGSLLLIGVWANIHNIFAIMPKGDTYSAGMFVVIIVGIGKLIDMFFGPSSEIIGLSPYYWFNLVIILVLAAIVVLCNYFFIPIYGINGAAYGSVLALVIFNVGKMIFIFFILKIHPFTKETLKVLFIALFVVLVNLILPQLENTFIDIAYRSTTISLIYGFMIFKSNCSIEINTVLVKAINLLTRGKKV